MFRSKIPQTLYKALSRKIISNILPVSRVVSLGPSIRLFRGHLLAALTKILKFVLGPPPLGVSGGRVRTAIFLRESMIWGRFRPESEGEFNFDLDFDLKYGWACSCVFLVPRVRGHATEGPP